MRVVVFGAGGVGSLLGARLARAGVDVLLIARPPHVEAILRDGLLVEGDSERPVRLNASARLASDRFDRLLLTVKANDLEEAARAIATAHPEPLPILAVQNGLGIRARLAAGFERAGWPEADRWVTRAILSVPVTFLRPGRVRLAGEGDVALGAEEPGRPLHGFDQLLSSTGLVLRRVASIELEEWRKALVNAAINPVTADHGIENGRLLEEPFRSQAVALLEEARTVAQLAGFPISTEEAESALFRIVRSTRSNRSSMLQDLDRGRPTEIDAISGEILRIGRRQGLDLPRTERAVRRIAARVAERRRG